MVYVERDLEKEISKYVKTKEIIAIVGARQCGKTTLVNNLLNKLEKKNKINRLSFDNVKILQLFENDIDSFIELHVKGFDILFIDEVQYSREGGKKLKYVQDNHKIKIFISGSSAAEISIHSLKFLVGRIFTFTLYPFSFKELLRFKDFKMVGLYESGKYSEEVIHRLNKYLNVFILYGGYPRVVLAKNVEEKKKVLEGIFNTYLLKEIKEILDLSDDGRLIKLLSALSLQIGNVVNYNELSSLTEFSYHDLRKYLNVLNKTYVSSLIKPFYTNKRLELAKSPKVYFFDLGFRNICIDNFSSDRTDKGSLYENFIFSELVKKDIKVKYWNTKSKAEVDFVIEKRNKLNPIEIKSAIKEVKVPKAFDSFVKKYKPEKGYVLSLDFDGKRKIADSEIYFMPFVKFIRKNF